MENDSSRVHTCTSAYFEGVIAMCQPNNSWVSRWQQIASFLPGMYAVQVVGELPQEDIDMCKAKVSAAVVRVLITLPPALAHTPVLSHPYTVTPPPHSPAPNLTATGLSLPRGREGDGRCQDCQAVVLSLDSV